MNGKTQRSVLVVILLSISFLWGQEEECACCSENHRAFDFWVGTWKVSNPDGTFAGTNAIAKRNADCLLLESWVGSNGEFTGSSLNFYNSGEERWEQLWVDSSGSHLKLSGNREGNRMTMASDELIDREGKPYRNRITWTLNENGTVRQLWELLRENQETQVLFDGLYEKKE